MNKETIRAQLPFCLTETDFHGIGEKYRGKVRDCYVRNSERILITSDRLSCFDKEVTSVPFKGEVLTSLAMFWFEKVKDVLPNHVISRPDPNVMIGREASVVPIEVVVRGYLTGSAWRDYAAGRAMSGIVLPQGMKKDQWFEKPLITPSTKAAIGDHDVPIAENEIIAQKIVPEALWNDIRVAALQLFDVGSRWANSRGLILVDTKYEFGLFEGKLILVDEIHTLDSSRYWVKDEYEKRFQAGQDQLMLDKEPTRQWLISQGFSGEGEIPVFTDDHRIQIAEHYIHSYEKITGQPFKGTTGDPIARVESALV